MITEIDKLNVTPIDFATASAFIDKYHRHHKRTVGHKFSIAVYLKNQLVGVAVCGRPVSRFLDNGKTIEINRLCVLGGIKNACSKLYSTCVKIAAKKGFDKVITYTLQSENGASLKASNFILEAENCGGKKWTGKRKHISTELKKRWVYIINQSNANN